MKKLIKRFAALFAAGCVFAANGVCFAIPASAAKGGSFKLTPEFVNCDELLNTSGAFMNLGISGGELQAGWSDAPEFAKILYSGATLTISDDGSFTCALPKSNNGKKTNGDHTDENILYIPIPAITFSGQIKDYKGGIAYWNEDGTIVNYSASAKVSPDTWDLSRDYEKTVGEKSHKNVIWYFNKGASLSTYYNAELDLAYVIFSFGAEEKWSNDDFPEWQDSWGKASFYFSVQHPDVADLRTETEIAEDSVFTAESKSDSSSEDDSVWIIQNESKKADDSAGEDSGTEINEEIITGKKHKHRDDDDDNDTSAAATAAAIAGGGGAAVAAGLAAANEAEKKKKKVSYKLHVYKDFGDTLPIGKTVYVYARIVKYTDGVPSPDNQLTLDIGIGSETVGSDPELFKRQIATIPMGLENSYMKFSVRIHDNKDTRFFFSDLGGYVNIKFIYKGKGGIFTESVRFKGAVPKLVLACKNDYGEFMERHGEEIESHPFDVFFAEKKRYRTAVTPLIFGDCRPYSLYVMAKGFIYEPETAEVTYKDPDIEIAGNYRITPVKAAPFVFELKLDNLTAPSDDKCGEKKCSDGGFNIKLSNSFKEESELFVPLEFYHEGFFAYHSNERTPAERFKPGCIEVYTNELTKTTSEHLEGTYFGVVCACKIAEATKDSVTIVEVIGNVKDFADVLSTDDEKTLKMVKQTDSFITLIGDDIMIRPRHVMLAPDPAVEYCCILKVETETRFCGKQKGEVPLRLFGEGENGANYQWQKEVIYAKRIIALYNLTNFTGEKFNSWIKDLYDHRLDASYLSKARRRLYDIGYLVEQEEFKFQMKEAAWYEFYLGFWEIVKLGNDMAFCMVVNILALKFHQDPDYCSAIAGICKKYFEKVIGDATVDIIHNEKGFSESFSKASDFTFDKAFDILMSAVEDVIFSKSNVTGISKKKLAAVIVAAGLLNFSKHYYLEGMKDYEIMEKGGTPQGDVFLRALILCVKDMTLRTAACALSRLLFTRKEKFMGKSTTTSSGELLEAVYKPEKAWRVLDVFKKKIALPENDPDKEKYIAVITVWCVEFISNESGSRVLDFMDADGRLTNAGIAAKNAIYEKARSTYGTMKVYVGELKAFIEVPVELLLNAAARQILINSGIDKIKDFLDSISSTVFPKHSEYIAPRELDRQLNDLGLVDEANRLNNGLVTG